MDRLTRRELLAATGIAAGSAGCISPPTDVGAPSTAQADPASQRSGDANGDYARVYRETVDSVALLEVFGDVASYSGSAFVYEGDYLITNHHVVADAEAIDVQYTGNNWASASVVGTDPHSDLAVVEVDGRPEYATPLPLSEERPSIGQEVIALGNPLGFDESVSQGIVSGVNRSIPAPTGFAIPDSIQTDAALNQGNSGGPLLNLDSEVVAVINAGAGEGVGFGISAALTRRVAPRLIEDGEFEHSYLGVELVDVTARVAEANDLPEAGGVLVVSVRPDTPADGVLRESEGFESNGRVEVPVGGDVIVAFDGNEIPTRDELSRYLALETDPGDELEITVLRDGEEQTVELTLGSRPETNS